MRIWLENVCSKNLAHKICQKYIKTSFYINLSNVMKYNQLNKKSKFLLKSFRVLFACSSHRFEKVFLIVKNEYSKSISVVIIH